MTKNVPLTLTKALWNLFWSAIDLLCLVTGVGFLLWTGLFMTPEYPGHEHSMQIIGMLLLVLGGMKK